MPKRTNATTYTCPNPSHSWTIDLTDEDIESSGFPICPDDTCLRAMQTEAQLKAA